MLSYPILLHADFNAIMLRYTPTLTLFCYVTCHSADRVVRAALSSIGTVFIHHTAVYYGDRLSQT
jgi:hypothetical protein